jgi:hypothetical protein
MMRMGRCYRIWIMMMVSYRGPDLSREIADAG